MKYSTFFIILLSSLLILSCGQKADKNENTAWMAKSDLTMDKILQHVKVDIEHAKSFKYTTENSTNINFYGGQKVNTFLLDSDGNAMSSRNREQIFKIDGKMYTRKIGLDEEGLVATVIYDILDKSTVPTNYFEKNAPYVKNNGIINVEMIKNCKITTSLSDNTLTIKTVDFKNIESKDSEYMTDITITYTPNKEAITKAIYLKHGEKITATYSFYINPNEKVKLPTLMKLGTILSAE